MANIKDVIIFSFLIIATAISITRSAIADLKTQLFNTIQWDLLVQVPGNAQVKSSLQRIM